MYIVVYCTVCVCVLYISCLLNVYYYMSICRTFRELTSPKDTWPVRLLLITVAPSLLVPFLTATLQLLSGLDAKSRKFPESFIFAMSDCVQVSVPVQACVSG